MSIVPPKEVHVTYQLQYRACGKASCGACRIGRRHGPYWYAFWREQRRLRSAYIGKTAPPSCRCLRCQRKSPVITESFSHEPGSAMP